MKSTAERLQLYKDALEKWKERKKRLDDPTYRGRNLPLGQKPVPSDFELSWDKWAKMIHDEVFGAEIKIPERRI